MADIKTNKQWFKSLDREGRKHVLSMLHEVRVSFRHFEGISNPEDVVSSYIKEFEDIHIKIF